MMYFSTGQRQPDYDGSLRPGDNLFTASIVALDYKTGQYKWHFQEVHHDIWDYDAPSPVVLFDQTYNGQPRKGLYQAGKTGWLYFLDRTNGQPLIGIDEKPVPQEPRQATAATQPYPGRRRVRRTSAPSRCRASRSPGCIFTPYWDVPVLLRPTASGGTELQPDLVSPADRLRVRHRASSRTARTGDLHATEDVRAGQALHRGVNASRRSARPISSTFTAMDSRTNKIVWQKRKPGDAELRRGDAPRAAWCSAARSTAT